MGSHCLPRGTKMSRRALWEGIGGGVRGAWGNFCVFSRNVGARGFGSPWKVVSVVRASSGAVASWTSMSMTLARNKLSGAVLDLDAYLRTHAASCVSCKSQMTVGFLCGAGAETIIFRVGFWQNGFFADFYFWAAEFFREFSRRIFSPHFCGKKCPEKSSRKIPAKILQNLYNKNPPTHFCRMAGAIIFVTGTSGR